MSGEMNGTNIVLQRHNPATGYLEVVGQIEITMVWNGAPIDISNKSFKDFITLLDGELSTKGMTFSGSIIYNGDAAFKALRDDRENGIISNYRLLYSVADAGENDYIFKAIPETMVDTLPRGAAATTAFSLKTSGQPLHEVNLISGDALNLISGDGFNLTAGTPIS